ncbi:Sulfur carrier protein FdhD [Austwickia sp. TVS 96-490-7B]|uniref:formate dehydrogenase accessory sulfurtransferase FdhD n=1 Tax=Austwickia sp. TVS 96-490-7B TaxID=2830843 RepID=UPI001C56BF85|nr:formate dehydrogenase accessory sulfurtransferase FdhD [Austwickia sp. TVS 96-490-7B]MBW3084847.1 Sulfur carrier protein FdhD [Austwickia sp. TVS 96-490-7B]
MGRLTVRRRLVTVTRPEPGVPCERRRRVDTLAVEEPLEIRVNGRSVAATVRTPGHDIELAHGLLHGAGIIRHRVDIATARYCAGAVATTPQSTAQNTYNLLDVTVSAGVRIPTDVGDPLPIGSTCGAATLDLVRVAEERSLHQDRTPVSATVLLDLPDLLRERHRDISTIRDIPTAGLFTTDGEVLVVREDISRRNAIDKVIGWALLHDRLPGNGLIVQISGRTSYDIVRRTVLAGIPVLSGVAAPSSLAVELAEDAGLTLVGLVRGDRMNVYTGAHRLTP